MARKYGAAAVAYIFTWLSGIIVYLLAKKSDKHTRFNAAQAIMIGVAIWILAWIPFFGWVVAMLLYFMGLYAAFKAYHGDKLEIPLLESLAKKFI